MSATDRPNNCLYSMPSELLTHHIFSFLEVNDLFFGCVLVCKKWYELVWKSPKSSIKIYNHNDQKLGLMLGLGRFNNVKGFELFNFDNSTLSLLLYSKQICKNVERLSIDGENGNDIGKEGAILMSKCKFQNLKYLSLKDLSKRGVSILINGPHHLETVQELWLYCEQISPVEVLKKMHHEYFPNLCTLNGESMYCDVEDDELLTGQSSSSTTSAALSGKHKNRLQKTRSIKISGKKFTKEKIRR